MSIFPVPDIMKDSIYELTPRLFTNRGIRFVLLDVDNTLAPYTVSEVTPRLRAWAQGMEDAGLELFILSNNRGDRPELFARELGLAWVKKAYKPFPRAARRVLAEKGYTPDQAAVIGDQVYTDTLCAKILGCTAVLVRPIAFTNPLLRIRYWLEFPFRLKCRWKDMK